MKAHVFISVLVFHVVVIGGLYLLSACSSSSNNTSGMEGNRASTTGGSIYDQYAEPNRPAQDETMVATPVSRPDTTRGIDPAFNSGSSNSVNTATNSQADRFEPRRPNEFNYGLQTTPALNEFNEDEVLEPIVAGTPVTASAEYLVKKGDSLWKISKQFGISLKTLLEANGLSEKSTIQVGQSLTIPSSTSGPTLAEASPASATSSEIHVVAKGDTLSRIAKQYNTSVNDIKVANGIPSDVIQLGQRLTIPVNSVSSGSPQVAPAPVSSPRVAPITTPPVSDNVVEGDLVHIVKSGETPGGIAKKYGITTTQLMKDNNIRLGVA
jgi:LysM repeat protein